MTREIVVVLSDVDWNYPCDYFKQITLGLSKKAEVIFLNPLYFPTLKNLAFDKKIRNEWMAPFKEKRIIYFPSLAIMPFQRFRFVEKLNIRLNLVLFCLFYLLRFGFQRPIFWVFSYECLEVIRFLRWGKLLVYDRADQNASLDSRKDQEIKQKEQQFLKEADYVFVNSPYALRYVKRYNQRSFLTPWGCASKLFLKKRVKMPGEIMKIKKPRLGLIGHIDHRTNFKLLYNLVRRNQSWNFLLVGPVFEFSPRQGYLVSLDQWISKLKGLPNIYFLGEKPKSTMPNYIAGLDVCLILYDTSQEFVKGCNPMKLYEYLAMGKPVVSTPIEAVKQHLPVVKIANGDSDFEKAIGEFLKTGFNRKEEDKRRKIAQENSWEKRIKKVWRLISK